MNDQLTLEDAVILIQIYQKRLNDAQAQSIAFEARTIRQQQQMNQLTEVINNLQQRLQEAETAAPTPKSTTRKVNTKKVLDSGTF